MSKIYSIHYQSEDYLINLDKVTHIERKENDLIIYYSDSFYQKFDFENKERAKEGFDSIEKYWGDK